MVAMHLKSTLATLVRPSTKSLFNSVATSRTVLTRIVGWYCYYCNLMQFGKIFYPIYKHRPWCVTNWLGFVVILNHIPHLQVFIGCGGHETLPAHQQSLLHGLNDSLLTFKCCRAILLMAFLRFKPPFFRLETLLCSRKIRFSDFLKWRGFSTVCPSEPV